MDGFKIDWGDARWVPSVIPSSANLLSEGWPVPFKLLREVFRHGTRLHLKFFAYGFDHSLGQMMSEIRVRPAADLRDASSDRIAEIQEDAFGCGADHHRRGAKAVGVVRQQPLLDVCSRDRIERGVTSEVGEIPARVRRVSAEMFKRSAALLRHMKERRTRIGKIEAPGQVARAEEIIEGREQGLVFIAGQLIPRDGELLRGFGQDCYRLKSAIRAKSRGDIRDRLQDRASNLRPVDRQR